MTIDREVYAGAITIAASSFSVVGQLTNPVIFKRHERTGTEVENNVMISHPSKNKSCDHRLFKDYALKERHLSNIHSRYQNHVEERETVNMAPKKTAETGPRLSFQMMTRAEPINLVMATIHSLLAIKDYDDEIVIVDNNHSETALYEPLAQFCAGLDPRLNVHFYHVDKVAGFKAGALNLALGLMDPNCTHVVVVDSDYQALPHARASIVTAINTYPEHGLLQFPQFYRDSNRADIHSELNHYFNYHLYRPFNRTRALSTGTYAVIRRQALLDLGGWSGASLTEDAQMGVLMHRQGLHGRFIPEVIAHGLLPTTVGDLMSQRRRWIYGNAQVLNHYFSSSSSLLPPVGSLKERFAYTRAHLSQLSAWLNFTGIFIVLQVCTLLLIASAWLLGTKMVLSLLLFPLYIVYGSYGMFVLRRLWAYMHDQAPLNQQLSNTVAPSRLARVRAWLLHLNFWELGALSWWPVLWGREKPFICTPKQEIDRTPHMANIMALPKFLLTLNVITALVVAPFSTLYNPWLFVCALMVCVLKVGAAKVMLVNYHHNTPQGMMNTSAHKIPPSFVVAEHTNQPQTFKPFNIKPTTTVTSIKNNKIVNS